MVSDTVDSDTPVESQIKILHKVDFVTFAQSG